MRETLEDKGFRAAHPVQAGGQLLHASSVISEKREPARGAVVADALADLHRRCNVRLPVNKPHNDLWNADPKREKFPPDHAVHIAWVLGRKCARVHHKTGLSDGMALEIPPGKKLARILLMQTTAHT